MEIAQSSCTEDVSGPTQISPLSLALYPISQPLSLILRAAILRTEDVEFRNVSSAELTPPAFKIVTEKMEIALEQIVRNCFAAIEEMYFLTPPKQRNKSSFQHRSCIRIACSKEEKTISITDFGCGMTRSDLINSLGVGRLSAKTITVAKLLDQKDRVDGIGAGISSFPSESEDNNSEVCYSSSDSESFAETTDSDEYSFKNRSDGINDQMNESHYEVSCKAKDIGGFYSALCALGSGVEVRTKSKFDDYYEFKVGTINHEQYKDLTSDREHDRKKDTSQAADLSQFSITRPMAEGVKPSVANGHNGISHVRGESGTLVKLTLSKDAIKAGFLEEEKILKPLMEKILEKSQYTVAFASLCSADEHESLINASDKEEEELETLCNIQNGDCIELEGIIKNGRNFNFDDKKISKAGSDNPAKERSKYIPLRLSMSERKILRLVEAAMTCCDYTTEVDKPFRTSAHRTHAQLKSVTSILRGIAISWDNSVGRKLVVEENYSDYEVLFRKIFEIARRHKIMNPEKMRTEYGKLVYLLQDAVSPLVRPHLGFSW